MKRFLIFLIFISILNAESIEHKIDRLTKNISSLNNIIKAIAKVESNFGEYKVNIFDRPFGSCGLTHINLKTYMSRHNIKETKFNINKACSDLIKNDELSIANSIEEVLYWKQQICNNECSKADMLYVYSAYNAGWNYKSRDGLEYAKKIDYLVKQYERGIK